MCNEREVLIEDWVASAAEMPSTSVVLRKRVLRSARRAERRRTVRRRVRWSLCGSVLAIAVAAWINVVITPAPDANAAANRSAAHLAPGESTGAKSPQPDWDLVDGVKRERAEQAGVIHGSF